MWLRTGFCFRASCMGSSKSKFQLSNVDVYRNAGRVVTQKCMVSDNLNTIGHTWSLFHFFTDSLLSYNSLHYFLSAPPPPEKWLESDPSNICRRILKNEWNPKGSFFVSSFAKFLFCRLLWKQHQKPLLKNLPPSREKCRGGLQIKMERPLGVRGQERGLLPFSLLSSLFLLEKPYTWLNYFFFHHHLEWGALTYLPHNPKQACD